MEPIPDYYTKDGFDHQLVSRHGNFAIYQKEKPEIVGFEVIRIKYQKENYNPSIGVTYSEKETIPPTSEWGMNGWSYTTEDRAREKVTALLQKEREKAEKKQEKTENE